MEYSEFVPYVGLLVGVLGRVIVPWLIKRLQEPNGLNWDWKKAWAQLLTGLLSFLALLAANPQLPTLTWTQALGLGLASAAAGWGFADAGREVKKVARPEG